MILSPFYYTIFSDWSIVVLITLSWLYVIVHGRGLAYGRLWTRDGKLAISVAQEGVVRGSVVNSLL